MPPKPPAEEFDPEQSEESLRRLHERETRIRGLAQAASTFLLIAGGATVAATVLMPTRVAGASRSARLEWQARQEEIDLAAARANGTPPCSPGASDATSTDRQHSLPTTLGTAAP